MHLTVMIRCRQLVNEVELVLAPYYCGVQILGAWDHF
jgi:hypothetical protein